MKKFLIYIFSLLAGLIFISGCRGYSTAQAPIHLNLNMDTQEKGRPYRESDFFDDHKIMREPIIGTIARGYLWEKDEHYYFGKTGNKLAKSLPKNLSIDENFIKRGQWVYNRTCAACHGLIGNGDGLVGRRLLVRPTSFHSEYLYNQPPGHFFDVIRNGIRTMKNYKHMLSIEDSWAVVSYIRPLQISQDSTGNWIKRSSWQWQQKRP